METDLDNKEYDPYEVSRTLVGKVCHIVCSTCKKKFLVIKNYC